MDDNHYSRAVDLLRAEGKISLTRIQLLLWVGYPAAAEIIERMEKEGLIGPHVPGVPRIFIGDLK